MSDQSPQPGTGQTPQPGTGHTSKPGTGQTPQPEVGQNSVPEAGQAEPEPANLRFLRLLVTILTGTMIAGLLVLIALLVIRFPSATAPLPDAISLPDGAKAQAFTVTPGWYAVVTTDDRILIYNRSDGALRQEITVQTE